MMVGRKCGVRGVGSGCGVRGAGYWADGAAGEEGKEGKGMCMTALGAMTLRAFRS